MKKALLYGELAKPRIVAPVLVTKALGFFLGERSIHQIVRLLLTLLGTGCATGGTTRGSLQRGSFDSTFRQKLLLFVLDNEKSVACQIDKGVYRQYC
jgi:hypothetical protein